ncbi:hypothetical protein R84B8_00627 [Treponema sp. R8-4-B8]
MKNVFRVLGIALIVAAIGLSMAACDDGNGGGIPKSSAKAITAFTFASPAATGTIDETAKTIGVTVPYGTEINALTPTVTHTGASYSPTGAQDFTNSVTYTVTAEDGSTQNYAVTVTIASVSAKAITAFYFTNPLATGTIDETEKTISVTVPFGTTVTALTPTVTHIGASYIPTGAQNFTVPVTYTVTAHDNSTQDYTVTVTVAPIGGTAPTITTASLPNGVVGTAYNQTLTANGDTPITWTLDGGTLPTGLSITGNAITGTPTTAATSTFTVKATNAAGSVTKQLSITINGATLSKAATPTASPSAGTYTSVQSVTLNTTTADAKIYYTTNGTNPTASSSLYSGAISIDTTTTLKAIAVKDGWNNSDIMTAVYTLNLPITLTENVWADGYLAGGYGGEQRFKFSATASTQYVHVKGSQGFSVNVQVYDSSGNPVGNSFYVNEYVEVKYLSLSVTEGQVYSINVWTSSASDSTYQILFNKSAFLPSVATPLTENVWANGNLPTSDDVQWFKFTATASTQYIHVSFGTLTDLYVQVYDSSGAAVGSESNLYGTTKYVSRTLTVGEEYYIRVRPYGSDSGMYRIGFTASIVSPGGTTPLTENVWANGNLPTSDDEQWFKFTATASTQYIHASFGTLTRMSVQLYDSNGVEVGSNSYLSRYTSRYVSQTVTAGQVYYIKVRPDDGSGTYRIVFNATWYPPEIIQLTANTWADGNLPTENDEQWFKFTATASTQYIHVNFSTPTESNRYSLWCQLYNSSGAAIGSQISFGTATALSLNVTISLNVNIGQEFYLKLSPASYSGTYKIAFGTCTIVPAMLPDEGDITTLTFDVPGKYYGSGWVTNWFKFTATANGHYIVMNGGTINVLVYDSSGGPLIDLIQLYETSYSTRRTYVSLTAGQEYYIQADSNGNGSIKFNTTGSW